MCFWHRRSKTHYVLIIFVATCAHLSHQICIFTKFWRWRALLRTVGAQLLLLFAAFRYFSAFWSKKPNPTFATIYNIRDVFSYVTQGRCVKYSIIYSMFVQLKDVKTTIKVIKNNETPSKSAIKLCAKKVARIIFNRKSIKNYCVLNIDVDFICKNIWVNNIDFHKPIMFSSLLRHKSWKTVCF